MATISEVVVQYERAMHEVFNQAFNQKAMVEEMCNIYNLDKSIIKGNKSTKLQRAINKAVEELK